MAGEKGFAPETLLGRGRDWASVDRGRILGLDPVQRPTVTSGPLERLARLLAALFCGALIGYERSFHGRPAGFRTHALVCTASSLLMLVGGVRGGVGGD